MPLTTFCNMNRKTRRLIEFGKRETKLVIEGGKGKKAARAAIRREFANAKDIKQPHRFAISVETWLRSQPNSTRKGFNRGNFQVPEYVVPGSFSLI